MHASRLTEKHRLRDAASFDRVFERATRSQDRWFTVLCRGNALDRARLGLAVAKKHCKNASARNRIKRVVRESFRHNLAGLAGLDVVVMNKAATVSADNKRLFDSLDAHWKKCRSAAGRTE